MDAVIPVEHAKPSWFAQTRGCVSTPVAFLNAIKNSVATMAVEACAEFVGPGHPANPMVNAESVPQIATKRCAVTMAAEAHVVNVHWEALAVLKDNASVHRIALEKNVEMTAVEGCVGHVRGANSAPHKTPVLRVCQTASANSGEMMVAGAPAENVPMG